MDVSVDGARIAVDAAATVEEVLEAVAPHVDPERLVTRLEIDGAALDVTDHAALAGRRLVGPESVAITTEAPAEFVRARRGEIPAHLARIADLLAAVAEGFSAGETVAANRGLAAAARELGLVLHLDRQLAALESVDPACGAIDAAIRRVGPRLELAERERRWSDVGALIAAELVPTLRAGIAAS